MNSKRELFGITIEASYYQSVNGIFIVAMAPISRDTQPRSSSRSGGQVKQGEVDAKKRTINLQALKEEQKRAEMARLQAIKEKVEEVLASNPKLAAMKSQIRLDMTADGLRIQIVDELNRAMFDSGSAVVQPHMRELLREIGSVLAEVPNRLTLEGHTDALGSDEYNLLLSQRRAAAVATCGSRALVSASLGAGTPALSAVRPADRSRAAFSMAVACPATPAVRSARSAWRTAS